MDVPPTQQPSYEPSKAPTSYAPSKQPTGGFPTMAPSQCHNAADAALGEFTCAQWLASDGVDCSSVEGACEDDGKRYCAHLMAILQIARELMEDVQSKRTFVMTEQPVEAPTVDPRGQAGDATRPLPWAHPTRRQYCRLRHSQPY